MAWYNLLSYLPPTTTGTGTLGGVGGGWNDVGSVWRPANLGGGASDNVVQTANTSSSPWTNAQLVRASPTENTQNIKVRFRWQITSGGLGAAPFAFLRYVKNTTDAQPNGLAVKAGQLYPITAGGLGSATSGSGSISAGSWYDTEVTATTNGASTTITETTTNVANRMTDPFGSGTVTANNTYTTSTFNTVSGSVGIFAYQPGTLSIQQFNTFSDVPATALLLSPASTSGSAGTSVTYALAVNGAQNGGAVTLSDGSAGGTFSPASVTLAAGAGSTASFTYTPGAGSTGSTVTLTASSAALTGATIAGAASIAVSASAATALSLAPSTQSVTAGASTGNYTLTTNGAVSGSVSVSLAASIGGGVFSPASITLTSGASSATFTYTPPASAATGTVTLTASASGLSSATASASVAAAATALALSPSMQTVAAGAASSNFALTANGALSGSVAVTLSDAGAGGAFSPSSVTLSSGSPSAAFVYTTSASSSGAVTLTAAATGLSNATATVTAVQSSALLTPMHPSVVVSPYNWIAGLPNSSVSGNTAARCWNPGAYLRVYVSGCTSLSVVFGASNTSAYFVYQIDDGLQSAPIACLNANSYMIALPDSQAHVVTWTLLSLPQASGRWAGTNAVVINGFQPGAGGVAAVATTGTRKLLIYGDSIAEGIQSRDGADGVATSFAYHIGETFRRQGWEYGIKAAGASGYSVTVAGSLGGQPAAWTAGNDAASSWNKVDGSSASGAALTTGSIGGPSERFTTAPDLVIDAWGCNDGLQNVPDATVQSAVVGFLQRLRVAAPNVIIVKATPFGGYKRTAIQAALAALGDPRILLVDTKTDARMTQSGYCGNIVAGTAGSQNVHPWSLGSAILGSYLAGLVHAAYVPFATARSFGAVS